MLSLTVKDHGQAWVQIYICHSKIPPTCLVNHFRYGTLMQTFLNARASRGSQWGDGFYGYQLKFWPHEG